MFNECKDEFSNFNETKSVVEDLFLIRKEKLIRIIKKVDPENQILFLSSVGCAELNYFRLSCD